MDSLPEEDGGDSICAACKASVDVALERGYAFGDEDEQALCFSCAVARGGVYDELHDHWVKPPDLAGLTIIPEELGPRPML